MVRALVAYADNAILRSAQVSTGVDVAIIIGSVLVVLAVAVVAFLVAKSRYQRRKELQHARVASRELDLDFDTSDLEFGAGRKPMNGHARGWSDASSDSSRPLMNETSGWPAHTPSGASFDSDIHSVRSSVGSLPNPHPSSPPEVVVHSASDSSPSPPKTTPPSADHQLGSLVGRPSFLTKPRPAPRPGQPRRTRSRGGAAVDMRSTLLTRLASARSGRRSRSADARDDGDSPSSMYSQASANTAAYWELEGEDTARNRADVPPVPPLPPQYQDQAAPIQRPLPPPPPSNSEIQSQPSVVGWRPDLMANDNTLDSNPFDTAGSGEKHATLAELEESLAFPLPSPSRMSFPMPSKSPTTSWFTGKFASQSPSSTSPSPTTAYIYPSHPSYPSIPAHPTDAVRALPAQPGDQMTVRSVEASRSVEEYDAVQSQHAGESGTVGYQMPANWRVGQPVELYDPPTRAISVQ